MSCRPGDARSGPRRDAPRLASRVHAAAYGRPVADEGFAASTGCPTCYPFRRQAAGHAEENPASHEYRAGGRVAGQRRPVYCGSVTDQSASQAAIRRRSRETPAYAARSAARPATRQAPPPWPAASGRPRRRPEGHRGQPARPVDPDHHDSAGPGARLCVDRPGARAPQVLPTGPAPGGSSAGKDTLPTDWTRRAQDRRHLAQPGLRPLGVQPGCRHPLACGQRRQGRARPGTPPAVPQGPRTRPGQPAGAADRGPATACAPAWQAESRSEPVVLSSPHQPIPPCSRGSWLPAAALTRRSRQGLSCM